MVSEHGMLKVSRGSRQPSKVQEGRTVEVSSEISEKQEPIFVRNKALKETETEWDAMRSL